MPIKRIKIKNCISIKNISFNVNNINCLLGENGTGKTNILKVIHYFYKKLTEDECDYNLFDKENPYNKFIEISITYDMTLFHSINFHNLMNNNFSFSNPFLKHISSFINRYSNSQKLIKVNMKQYRNELPEWNLDYQSRKLIKSLFPIYFIKSRDIKLTEWESLWSVIGDLNKISLELKHNIDDEIANTFKNITNKENAKIFKFIKNQIKKSGLNVKNFSPKETFNYISQLQLGGNKFTRNDKELDFFSDGINSYGYLKLMLNLVKKISQKKLKEPLIIIDEPEISLHPNYIDYLIEKMAGKVDNRMKILMATHSPRVVKNVIKNNRNNSIFHLVINNSYTDLEKMKNITRNDSGFNSITDTEASFYFSKGIVFVEGDSDRELFLNKNILNLYPKLKKVDFYHHLSEVNKAKLVSPKERGYTVPHLLVVDLDKILKYNHNNKRISIKGNESDFVNPFNNEKINRKENFLYGKKRRRIYKLHKNINDVLDINYNFDDYWGTIKNNMFLNLKKSVRDYCLYYNVFPLDTTMEGMLINKNNYNIFLKWVINNKKESIIKNIINHKNSVDYKVTVLRLIFKGKYNNLNTRKQQLKIIGDIKNKDKQEMKIYNSIESILEDKTSGWITNFLNYFFKNYIDDNQTLKMKRVIFEKNFPELSLLIEKVVGLLC